MSASRIGRMQKAAVLVPLALLSTAWTVSVAGTGPEANVDAKSEDTPSAAPSEGPEVPAEAIEKPASVSKPDQAGEGFEGTPEEIEAIVSTSSTNGIPASALTAYQRAETVINAADPGCKLTWQLIAAIGRVESNHGRYGGSALNDDGVAVPGIYGIALNGKNSTALIRDTDAGRLDNDTTYDRAVGPMQFIPSTWASVQVDADNDGRRDPQDIDDAALATAVYLCSGDGDLSTLSGQRAAVYRYNHSDTYVDLVLSIMENYLAGDYTSVPDSTQAAGYIPPSPARPDDERPGNGTKNPGPGTDDDAAQPGTDLPDPTPTENPDDTDNGGNEEKPDKPGKPDKPNGPLPDTGVDTPDLPDTGIKPVDDVLTYAQALVQCTLDGYLNNPLVRNDPYDQCVKDYTRP